MNRDPKPKPNEPIYQEILRQMTPTQRLNKAFELTELSRRLFWAGLRHRFPDLPEAELCKIYLERLAECHNQDC